MYVRLVQFNLGPGQQSAAEAVADKVVPVIRDQQGCHTCEFFVDDKAGDYGMVVLWNSQEDADAAATIVSPILRPALAAIANGEPSIRLFEVYEPKG